LSAHAAHIPLERSLIVTIYCLGTFVTATAWAPSSPRHRTATARLCRRAAVAPGRPAPTDARRPGRLALPRPGYPDAPL